MVLGAEERAMDPGGSGCWRRGDGLWCAGVQPRLIQGIRSGDGVGDLFNYLFFKDIKSNRIRIAQ